MKISAGLDLDVVALEQRDEFTLLVELTAPDTPSEAERIPATLQVVLDRSGSMGGGRPAAPAPRCSRWSTAWNRPTIWASSRSTTRPRSWSRPAR